MNTTANALVIVPTYNEIENISSLISEILKHEDADVLIIDDNSPDGTANSITSSFTGEERVHLIRREAKLGLGTAYTAGFHFAITNQYEFTITMDADFSHDPKDIPRLLQKRGSADVVIGSRYVPGGETLHWGILRKIISRTANLVAHQVLNLQPRDCTSGFRMYRTESLGRLNFQTIYADGYSYLVEILFRAVQQGLRIEEIPIIFTDRQRGKSKISRKEIYKAIHTIFRLRFASR